MAKEQEELGKKLKVYTKRSFACEEDARLEMMKLTKDLYKLKFHQVQFDIKEALKRKPGQPSPGKEPALVYHLIPTLTHRR